MDCCKYRIAAVHAELGQKEAAILLGKLLIFVTHVPGTRDFAIGEGSGGLAHVAAAHTDGTHLPYLSSFLTISPKGYRSMVALASIDITEGIWE